MIDEHLARRLIDTQFPHWADLPIARVALDGVDNRTFRLGERMTVRLPSGPWYALQVAKEQRWLPRLAPRLPLPIPAPIAQGEPGEGYPYAWSVYGWLDGEPASAPAIRDLTEFATGLAGFLVALGDEIDGDAAARVWADAVAAAWTGDAVWFHGDIATGNLLLRDGRLGAVIDFGTSGVGDPACDVVIAWTLLSGASRAAFRSALGADAGTWSRGRGWALWKALITLAGALEAGDDAAAALPRRVIDRVLADHAGQC